TQTITLTPLDDALVEGNETLALTPSGSTLDGQVTYTAGTVTIDDADAATVSVDAVTLNENGTAQNVTVRLSTLAGVSLENPLVVVIGATDVTTEGASDFNAGAFPKTLSFPTRRSSDLTQTITLTPLDDALVEGNET